MQQEEHGEAEASNVRRQHISVAALAAAGEDICPCFDRKRALGPPAEEPPLQRPYNNTAGRNPIDPALLAATGRQSSSAQ